ncbi:hypothetical protein Vadar_033889 [Vaccinium darrowii]|uniref:Uncharacterized protein n=1 Tax=Vaccinium darrowii TaxID=229202 RepID=A0ACB7Z1C0_9ERIC|nr:hypothetical protein Vadar_033889 [Vaccinium darrowii]
MLADYQPYMDFGCGPLFHLSTWLIRHPAIPIARALRTTVSLRAIVPLGELLFFHMILIRKVSSFEALLLSLMCVRVSLCMVVESKSFLLQGITTYGYVVAMRAQSEPPGPSVVGEDQYSLPSSPTSSAMPEISGKSSVKWACNIKVLGVPHQESLWTTRKPGCLSLQRQGVPLVVLLSGYAEAAALYGSEVLILEGTFLFNVLHTLAGKLLRDQIQKSLHLIHFTVAGKIRRPEKFADRKNSSAGKGRTVVVASQGAWVSSTSTNRELSYSLMSWDNGVSSVPSLIPFQ